MKTNIMLSKVSQSFLDKISKQFGISKACFVRMSVLDFYRYITKTDAGKVRVLIQDEPKTTFNLSGKIVEIVKKKAEEIDEDMSVVVEACILKKVGVV